MNIKDIVNRDIVNLTNCEQEPIHIPGSIQPHGFLTAITKDSHIVEYCSGNIFDYTGINYTDVLGRKFEDVFRQEALVSLMAYIDKGQMLSSTLLKLTLAGHDFVCTVHERDNMYIIEAEPASIAHKDPSYEYDQTKQFLDYMHDTHTLKELCQIVTKDISDIT